MDPLEINLNHLRHFHAVAAEGSLKAAGQRVGVAPSTLSEQMRLLEDVLGQALFDRSGGRLRLNDAGRRVHRRTTTMLKAVQDIVHDFELDVPIDRPVMAIGVSSSVSNAFTAEYFLPLFERDDLHVVIRQGDHQGLLQQLLAHEIDLLLSEHTPADPESKNLRVRMVSRPSLVAVAAPELASRLGSDWPRSLEGAPYLNYTAHSSYRWHVDGYLDRHDVMGKLVGEVDDLGVVLATARRGVCVAFLPESVVASFGRSDLAELGRISSPSGGVSAIYRDYEPPKPVREAIETLLRTHPADRRPPTADATRSPSSAPPTGEVERDPAA